MTCTTTIGSRMVADQRIETVTLINGKASAEWWPGVGGMCVRWVSQQGDDILDAPPAAELLDRPTRGGIPVLFPFPNRIRAGVFEHAGLRWQLPCNDSTKQNAIHGFTPRAPWRVKNTGATETCASMTLEFDLALDGPQCRGQWPANFRITIDYSLQSDALWLDIRLLNEGPGTLPFGFGLHPYFRLTSPTDRVVANCASRWELVESLPSGRKERLSADFDLRKPRLVSELTLDDVYADVYSSPNAQGLRELARLERRTGKTLFVLGDSSFRELVLFTPPHRRSICLEPYTCVTDAVNLQARGIDAGWQTLDAGGQWSAKVRFQLAPPTNP